jgi:excisionase family DNA binding protein
MNTATEAGCQRETLAADGLMSIDEAVRFSRTSRSHVCRLMADGRLAYVRMGRRRLVVRRSLIGMLARGMVVGRESRRG